VADDQQETEQQADESAQFAQSSMAQPESAADEQAALEQTADSQLQETMAESDARDADQSVAENHGAAELDSYRGHFEYARPEDAYGDECDMPSHAQTAEQAASDEETSDSAMAVADDHAATDDAQASDEETSDSEMAVADDHAATDDAQASDEEASDSAMAVADDHASMNEEEANDGGVNDGNRIAAGETDEKSNSGFRPEESPSDELSSGDQGLSDAPTQMAGDAAAAKEPSDAGEQAADRAEAADEQGEHGYGYGYEYARPQEVYGDRYSEDRDEKSFFDESGKREPGSVAETAESRDVPTDSNADGYEHSWTHEKYGNSVDASGQATEQAAEEIGDETSEHGADRFGSGAENSAASHGMDRLDATPNQSGNDQGKSQSPHAAAGNVRPNGASLEEDCNEEANGDEAMPDRAVAGPARSSGSTSIAGLPGIHDTEVAGAEDEEDVVSETGDDSRQHSDLTDVPHAISSGMASVTALLDRCKAAVRPLQSLPAGLDWRSLLLYGEKAVTAMGDRPENSSLQR
jgi:hypothetical protein